jgi:hypothetical protein
VLDQSAGYAYPFVSALSRVNQEFADTVGHQQGSNITFPVAHPLKALATGTRSFL